MSSQPQSPKSPTSRPERSSPEAQYQPETSHQAEASTLPGRSSAEFSSARTKTTDNIARKTAEEAATKPALARTGAPCAESRGSAGPDENALSPPLSDILNIASTRLLDQGTPAQTASRTSINSTVFGPPNADETRLSLGNEPQRALSRKTVEDEIPAREETPHSSTRRGLGQVSQGLNTSEGKPTAGSAGGFVPWIRSLFGCVLFQKKDDEDG